MAKIVVRLPEPRKEYTEDNQRQINRTITSMITQLNSTFLKNMREQQERFTWFIN
jgi:hypothetical protein|tara:strand:- start:139 stop:303 length:165 start_codon:yes stop_codon:yes gene_type:complete